jgi:hypothetical protein
VERALHGVVGAAGGRQASLTRRPVPASGLGRAQDPEVAAAGDLHRFRLPPLGADGPCGPLRRPGRLADGVGERFEVVAGGPGRAGADGKTYDVPTAWGGQALGVLRAQVVAVWFGICGQGPEDGGRVRVDVRQRRDGRTTARGTRTATYRAHDVGRYRTLDRSATTLPDLTPPCRPGTRPVPDLRPPMLTCGETCSPTG